MRFGEQKKMTPARAVALAVAGVLALGLAVLAAG
jgi:hypothetical protein